MRFLKTFAALLGWMAGTAFLAALAASLVAGVLYVGERLALLYSRLPWLGVDRIGSNEHPHPAAMLMTLATFAAVIVGVVGFVQMMNEPVPEAPTEPKPEPLQPVIKVIK